MKKINFRQPKYIFPAVIFVPLCALIYFVMQTFGGGEDESNTVATDRINASLPEAHAEAPGDKMFEMSRRFNDEDAFTAVGALGEEQTREETLEHGYSEEELNRLDAAEAERIRHAGGRSGRFCRLCGGDQPRPLVPGPYLYPYPGFRRKQRGILL